MALILLQSASASDGVLFLLVEMLLFQIAVDDTVIGVIVLLCVSIYPYLGFIDVALLSRVRCVHVSEKNYLFSWLLQL